MMSVAFSDKISVLTRAFGGLEVCKDNTNVTATCPACAKKGSSKKKLSIRLDDGRFHCWVCGSKGRSILQVLRRINPAIFEEAKKYFKTKSKSLNLFGEEDDPALDVAEIVEAPKNYRLLGDLVDSKNPNVKEVLRYCFDRGLRLRDLWRFKLGMSDEPQFLRRVIIPSFDEDGSLNFYSARSIDRVQRVKYLNATSQKIKIIFNEINVDWAEEITLVEGPFDLMKCGDNATCLLGSQLSRESRLFRQIIRNQTPVLLALDPDVIQKSHKIASNLASFGVHVRMAEIPPARDVGDMSHEEFEDIRLRAPVWDFNSQLFTMISSIKSGSLL